MSQNFNIQPYRAPQEADILALLRLNTPAAFAPSEEADFIEYLREKRDQYFVVASAERIVGCGGINTADEGVTGVISWDMIHPEYHGMGIGSRLLQHRLKILHQMPGVQKIIVRTSQFAHHFYGKHGFDLISKHPDYWAPGYDMYLMEFRG